MVATSVSKTVQFMFLTERAEEDEELRQCLVKLADRATWQAKADSLFPIEQVQKSLIEIAEALDLDWPFDEEQEDDGLDTTIGRK